MRFHYGMLNFMFFLILIFDLRENTEIINDLLHECVLPHVITVLIANRPTFILQLHVSVDDPCMFIDLKF